MEKCTKFVQFSALVYDGGPSPKRPVRRRFAKGILSSESNMQLLVLDTSEGILVATVSETCLDLVRLFGHFQLRCTDDPYIGSLMEKQKTGKACFCHPMCQPNCVSMASVPVVGLFYACMSHIYDLQPSRSPITTEFSWFFFYKDFLHGSSLADKAQTRWF